MTVNVSQKVDTARIVILVKFVSILTQHVMCTCKLEILLSSQLSLAATWMVQEPSVVARFGFLYSGYRLHYWETFEMVRKLLLAAVPVFVPPQPFGSTQVNLLHRPGLLHTPDINTMLALAF